MVVIVCNAVETTVMPLSHKNANKKCHRCIISLNFNMSSSFEMYKSTLEYINKKIKCIQTIEKINIFKLEKPIQSEYRSNGTILNPYHAFVDEKEPDMLDDKLRLIIQGKLRNF